jgi:hypothetical protein
VDNFTITAGNNGFDESEVEVNEAPIAEPFTPLISLKNRRQAIADDLYLDIRVPRWESPEIYVRFKPISATKLNATIERRRKTKADNWTFLANADMLVVSCIGIYAQVEGSDGKFSLRENDANGTWTKFDKDLAQALGIDANSAVESCVGLYFSEGDLLDTANKLFRWSNIAGEEADGLF